MARGNIYRGLLSRILQVILEDGESRAYSSAEVTEMLRLRGEWEGKNAKTPERTINSYFNQNPDIFKNAGAGFFHLKPEYKKKLSSNNPDLTSITQSISSSPLSKQETHNKGAPTKQGPDRHDTDNEVKRDIQSAIEPPPLDIQGAVELRLDLLNGQRRLEAFDRLSMQDVTDDEDLCSIYNESGLHSFSAFLALGKKRLQLPGYHQESELALKSSLRSYLRDKAPLHIDKSTALKESDFEDKTSNRTPNTTPTPIKQSVADDSCNSTENVQDAVELLLGLLYGRNHLEAFDRLSMHDVTDDEELCRIYEESKILSFSHFLALGNQRFLLPHYKQSSEHMLKDILRTFLRKFTSKKQTEGSEQIDQHKIQSQAISKATTVEEQIPTIEPPHPEQPAIQPGLVEKLLDGSTQWELFDHKQMDDLTDDSALCAYYEKSHCKNLSEFLALSEKRFDIRGYWQPCEEKLEFVLRSYFTIEAPSLHDERKDETSSQSPDLATTKQSAPSYSDVGDISDFVDQLMAGSSTWQPLDQIEMKELSSNNGLRYYYELSECTNLSEFIALTDKRFAIRGYWQGSEKRLKEELIKFFESKALEEAVLDSNSCISDALTTGYGQNLEDIPSPRLNTTDQRSTPKPNATETLTESPLIKKEGESVIQQEQRHRLLTAQLMHGSVRWSAFDKVSISDITQHPTLYRFYERMNAGNLSEFLALGRKRMSNPGYGNGTEQKLREALLHYFKTNSTSAKIPSSLVRQEDTPVKQETDELRTPSKQSVSKTETPRACPPLVKEKLEITPKISSEPQYTSTNSVKELTQELLSGDAHIEALDDLSIGDISSDVRLTNTYENSLSSSISEFLALGERRIEIKNYGKRSERKLREAIEAFLIRHGNETPLFTQSSKKDIPLDHDHLLEALQNGENTEQVVNSKAWQRLCEDLKHSELSQQKISPTAAELEMNWPLSLRSPLSDKRISDYLDYDLTEIRNLNRFGREKVRVYAACVIYLHKRHKHGTREAKRDLKDAVLATWQNSGLTDREKTVIELRFGIETRKHTLVEVKPRFGVTRERIRQIQKTAIRKLQMSPHFPKVLELITEEKESIWSKLSQAPQLSKSIDLHQLEHALPFEEHLAIELTADRRNRSISQPALGDWLDANFNHDESNWYTSSSDMPTTSKLSEPVNPSLEAFLDTL